MPPSENTNSAYYPIGLNLIGQPVLIVGGGQVATRKLERLLTTGCHVTVVSPQVSQDLQEVLAQGALSSVTLLTQKYDKTLLETLKPVLVFACTNDETVNRRVAEDAGALNIWVNSATHGVSHSDFIVPSLVTYEMLQIALFSGGASPLFVRQLRESIEGLLGPWVVPYLQVVQLVRRQIQLKVSNESERRACYEMLLNDPVLLNAVQQPAVAVELLAEDAVNRLFMGTENFSPPVSSVGSSQVE